MYKNEDDKVGPGHPPKEYRWKKGGPSPNPRGRPPKKKLEQLCAGLDYHAEMIDRFNKREIMSSEGPIELREANFRSLNEMA